jgi:hypothetical protein
VPICPKHPQPKHSLKLNKALATPGQMVGFVALLTCYMACILRSKQSAILHA